MKNLVKIQYKQLVFTAIATVAFLVAASSLAVAQDQTYKTGDRVEVQRAEGWLKGEVVDDSSGRGYTIRYEWEGKKFDMYAFSKDLRLIAGATQPENQNKKEADKELENQPDRKNDTPNQPQSQNQALKYKIGDRVECDRTYMNSREKGTVVPLRKTDFQDGKTYRVLLDSYAKVGLYLDGHECRVDAMRLLAGAAPFKNEPTAVPVGKATVDAENTLSADRPILECPVKQTPVKNGARPNAELFKKIIRCRKGEKPAAKGYDGAVTVDVTVLQPGATRPWIYGRDIGGKPGTIIHPVKTTFHYKTFYRSSTEVSQNWIRIINFFVNDFGEWETGSEESVKMGETVNIPRDQ